MARILVIEDNTTQVDSIVDILQSLHHTVQSARDGKEAIKKATSENFDLALLDIDLPDMDGKHICKWLKENPSTRMMPIIIITALDNLLEKVEGLDSGANDFLGKPFSELEFKARVASCLRTKALQDELEDTNTTLHEVLKEMEKLTITDSLTGLYNRRHFTALLEKEFNRHMRYKHPVTFMMLDLDNFKQINDAYGHNIGDMVLKKVSEVLRSTLRSADVIARWGGEEFIIFLPESRFKEVGDVAEKLRAGVENMEFEFPNDLNVTISIGVCCAPEIEIKSASMFVDSADKALFKAKENGKNRVEIYMEDS